MPSRRRTRRCSLKAITALFRYPGLEPGKGYATTYGFVLTVNAQASQEKQAALHDFYKFFMAEPLEVWKETAPFAHIRRAGGWQQDTAVTSFPNAKWLLQSREEGVALPRTLVYNELGDAMQRPVQKIVPNSADIRGSRKEAAAEVDGATAPYKRSYPRRICGPPPGTRHARHATPGSPDWVAPG